ncbi:MAG TPA: hypothetical protein VFY81_15645 [Gammaproteobacteria bacterium]|nr:hypothetical protein [Gammaproteobacteria bacterium]
MCRQAAGGTGRSDASRTEPEIFLIELDFLRLFLTPCPSRHNGFSKIRGNKNGVDTKYQRLNLAGKLVGFALKRLAAPSGRLRELYLFQLQQPRNWITISLFGTNCFLQSPHNRDMLLSYRVALRSGKVLQRHRSLLELPQLRWGKFAQAQPDRFEIPLQTSLQYCCGNLIHSSS